MTLRRSGGRSSGPDFLGRLTPLTFREPHLRVCAENRELSRRRCPSPPPTCRSAAFGCGASIPSLPTEFSRTCLSEGPLDARGLYRFFVQVAITVVRLTPAFSDQTTLASLRNQVRTRRHEAIAEPLREVTHEHHREPSKVSVRSVVLVAASRAEDRGRIVRRKRMTA